MNNYKLYDEILATIFQNIMVEKERDDGIYVNGYYDNYICNTYMKMVESVADITDTPIVMLMPLFSYIKFKFRHWKVRKRYKWVSNYQQYQGDATPILVIANYVVTYFNQPLSIYKDIYKEFYA